MNTQSFTLFTDIEKLVPTMHGWCSVPKAHTLAAMVLALRPKTVVEIGVWGGRSLIPMAMAIRELGQGKVYGIDPWSAGASEQGQINEHDRAFWGNQNNHELVYNDFLRQLKVNRVESVVDVQRCPSDVATVPDGIGVLHIDGNHSDQAVKDVIKFAPLCEPGAFCVMDDIGWSGGGVERAVGRLKSLGWKELYTLDTGAVYQKRS